MDNIFYWAFKEDQPEWHQRSFQCTRHSKRAIVNGINDLSNVLQFYSSPKAIAEAWETHKNITKLLVVYHEESGGGDEK